MNKKIRRGIIVFTVCLVTVILTAFSYSKNFWDAFESKEGVYKSIFGVLVELPNQKQKEKVVKSIDPITGRPTIKLEKMRPVNEMKQTMTIPFHHDRISDQLDISYVIRDGKPYFINDRSFYIHQKPSVDVAILEYEFSLYTVDLEQRKISKLLKDQVNGLDIEKDFLASKNKRQGFVPKWGVAPEMNNSGTKMLFYRYLKEGEPGQIWVKDLLSGDEKPIYTGPFTFVGWGKDSLAYIEDSGQIIEINLETGEYRVKVERTISSSTVVDPYLLYQENRGELTIVHLDTNERNVFDRVKVGRVGFMKPNEKNNTVILYHSPNYKLDYELIVLHLDTLQFVVIPPPENVEIMDAEWHTEYSFLVHTRELGIKDEKTYLIDLNQLMAPVYPILKEK